jgi:hypothetical protein
MRITESASYQTSPVTQRLVVNNRITRSHGSADDGDRNMSMARAPRMHCRRGGTSQGFLPVKMPETGWKAANSRAVPGAGPGFGNSTAHESSRSHPKMRQAGWISEPQQDRST